MPRVRRIARIGFGDGESRITETILSDDASVERRFEELIAVTSEAAGEEGVLMMWAICNGCGRRVEVTEPALPDGWTAIPGEGDFCERCS